MEEEIGKTAGAIWQALKHPRRIVAHTTEEPGESNSPVFDWAIGWLAREDQIVIPAEKRSFRIRTQRGRAHY